MTYQMVGNTTTMASPKHSSMNGRVFRVEIWKGIEGATVQRRERPFSMRQATHSGTAASPRTNVSPSGISEKTASNRGHWATVAVVVG